MAVRVLYHISMAVTGGQYIQILVKNIDRKGP